MAKRSKASAEYRRRTVVGFTCHTCRHRIARGERPSACMLVVGTVDREHVCKLWRPGPPHV